MAPQERAIAPEARWRSTGPAAYACDAAEAALFAALSARLGVRTTVLAEPLSEATAGLASGHRSISVDHRTPVTEALLHVLHGLGVEHVTSRSVGLDHLDVGAARELGIGVEAVGYAPDGVADFTVMSILMALRHAEAALLATARHDFTLRARGRDLRDLTVGVVGAGRIGAAVVERLGGFGCRVLVTTRGPSVPIGAEPVSFDDLLRRSDVVTLHVPLEPGTRHLLGDEELARMKRGAILVNTSRGALVDTDALVAALDRGQLAGAALDVLEGEDGVFYRDWAGGEVRHPHLGALIERPDVIVTPHTAFHTERTLHDTVERTLASCITFERERTHAQADDRDPVRRLLRGA